MRGHSSLRREPAVLLMYRGVEGYKEAEDVLRSLNTQLCLAKRDGSGRLMLRTGSSKLETACGVHTESQRSMISGPCMVDVSRHAWCSERESCRVRTAAPRPPHGSSTVDVSDDTSGVALDAHHRNATLAVPCVRRVLTREMLHTFGGLSSTMQGCAA